MRRLRDFLDRAPGPAGTDPLRSTIMTHPQDQAAALAYLHSQFGASAPETLRELAHFPDSPLEGEGAVTIYGFTASPGGQPGAYHVVAGATEPNYYPSWNLSPEEVYDLHLGTRFMLVVGVSQLALDQLPADLEEQARSVLAGAVPGAEVSGWQPAAAFLVEGQMHTVARCRIGSEDVYVITGDIPLGISRRSDLSPQVVYRIHLGHIIRLEPQED